MRLPGCVLAWLVAGAAGTGGCTLTDKSFEPTRIDGTETRSEPALSAAPSPSEASPPSEPANTQPTPDTEGLPNVRPPTTQASMLEPGGVSAQTNDADAGATPTGSDGPPDAGTTVETADAGSVQQPPVEEPPVVEPPVVEPPSNPCDSLSFGGSCYELFDSFVSWDAAEQQCVTWGGHLASIGSAAENAFLNGWPAQIGLFNADGQGIWVGGTDAQQDGTFRWIDGTSFSFTGWGPAQPDDGAGTDCIEKRNDGVGQWYDRHCTDSLRYMCERPL